MIEVGILVKILLGIIYTQMKQIQYIIVKGVKKGLKMIDMVLWQNGKLQYLKRGCDGYSIAQ